MDKGRGEGVRASLPVRAARRQAEGRGRREGPHAAVPPHIAGRKHAEHGARGGRPYEVSRAGAGRWPGWKTATTPAVSPVERRRRPASHAGHRVRSMSVSRRTRVATDPGWRPFLAKPADGCSTSGGDLRDPAVEGASGRPADPDVPAPPLGSGLLAGASYQRYHLVRNVQGSG